MLVIVFLNITRISIHWWIPSFEIIQLETLNVEHLFYKAESNHKNWGNMRKIYIISLYIDAKFCWSKLVQVAVSFLSRLVFSSKKGVILLKIKIQNSCSYTHASTLRISIWILCFCDNTYSVNLLHYAPTPYEKNLLNQFCLYHILTWTE